MQTPTIDHVGAHESGPPQVLIPEVRRETRRRRQWWIAAALLVVVAALIGFIVFIGGKGSEPRSTVPATIPRVPRNPYPASSCDSKHPTALLLPTGGLPHMVLSPGPATASGGSPIDLGTGIVTPNSRRGPSSDAVIWEQFLNVSAPRSAIQNADPYNVAHPRAVTIFDEALTGFDSTSAEATLYRRGLPSPFPPDGELNGHSVPEDVVSSTNIRALLLPSEEVTYWLPSSDTPSNVMVSLRSGGTIIAFNFEGGSDLSLRDVLPIVNAALNRISSMCGGTDIMANH